jgi:hypothetical protein
MLTIYVRKHLRVKSEVGLVVLDAWVHQRRLDDPAHQSARDGVKTSRLVSAACPARADQTVRRRPRRASKFGGGIATARQNPLRNTAKAEGVPGRSSTKSIDRLEPGRVYAPLEKDLMVRTRVSRH